MQVIERTEGHYDVQEVQFGTVYRWCPECVVLECYCGERQTLTHSQSTCPECDADHTSIVREELAARRARVPPVGRGTKPYTPGTTPRIAKRWGYLANTSPTYYTAHSYCPGGPRR